MIAVFVIAFLACLALAYVAQPLLSGPKHDRDDDRDLSIEEAEARKQAALVAIVDIEEEKEIGKLSDADFDALRAQYERQALEALRELDIMTAHGTAREDELEAEIAEMRRQMACPHCGALRIPASEAEERNECARCGR